MLPCWPGAHNELTGQPTRGKEPAPLRQSAAKRQSQVSCTQWSTSSLGAACRVSAANGLPPPYGEDQGRQGQHRLDRGEVRGPLRGCLTQD